MTPIKNPQDHDRFAFAVTWQDGQWVAERIEKGWLVRVIMKPDGAHEEQFIKQVKSS
jgi:hypothetical protein